jgi:hypothetical protein
MSTLIAGSTLMTADKRQKSLKGTFLTRFSIVFGRGSMDRMNSPLSTLIGAIVMANESEVIEPVESAETHASPPTVDMETTATPAKPHQKKANKKKSSSSDTPVPSAGSAESTEPGAAGPEHGSSAAVSDGKPQKQRIVRLDEKGNPIPFEPYWLKRGKANIKRLESQSMVFMKSTLTLKHRHAQEVFGRTNDFWSEAMITLSETMRNFKPEDQCQSVDAEVDRQLDVCLKAIADEKARLKAVADTNGVDLDDIEVEYTKPMTLEIRIISPRELRFHRLLGELDVTCQMMDMLWLLKLVSDRSRSQSAYAIKRLIVRTSSQIRNLVFRAQASHQRSGSENPTDPRSGTVLDPENRKKAKHQANATTKTDEVEPIVEGQAEDLAAVTTAGSDADQQTADASSQLVA